jgi:molybdopterin molybdotransferase
MLQYEDALARILAVIPAPASERIPAGEAVGRILAEEITSQIDLPPFDNSAMDGYAVRAQDVASARLDSPARLRLVGRVAAGGKFSGEVNGGTCIRLFTGSSLPAGADAVVMQEDTKLDAAAPNEVLIFDSVKPWENVRFRGEDVKRGASLVAKGEAVTVGRLALLAATGCEDVIVSRPPVVGIVATGSELKEPGQSLDPGQIYESNRPALAALVRKASAIPRIYPVVTDVLEATRLALSAALKECDVVVTSGGVSVGEMDFVKQAVIDLGGELEYWKVAIKPGRPFVFGRLPVAGGNKLFFGLPGNPVSALVTFLLLVRPAILRWQGASYVAPPIRPAILAEPLENQGERRHFMRVRIATDGKVLSAGVQASHVLSSLAAADGLVDVPARTTLAAGTTVQVLLWE